MEFVSAESSIKFSPSKRFRGGISGVEITEENGSAKKVFTIARPQTLDLSTRKFCNYGKRAAQGSEGPGFRFTPIRVELKKQWMGLDLFDGLEVFLFGNFEPDSPGDLKLMKIPRKSGYKNVARVNFMTVEPSM